MGLTAQQINGKIRLVWTYEPPPPFWLEFEPEYDKDKTTYNTNTVIIPQDCVLYMDVEVLGDAVTTQYDWYVDGVRVVGYNSIGDGWVNRTVSLVAGCELYLYGSLFMRRDVQLTMILRINDEMGAKVAEFDLEFKAQCFLTTACVNHYGKSDNGPELTAMRKLREHYIDKPGYKELIDQYYQLSAQIIKGIEAEKDPGLIYAAIYESVKACEKAVGSGDWIGAHDEYLDMYYKLVEKYCPERKNTIVDDVIRRR